MNLAITEKTDYTQLVKCTEELKQLVDNNTIQTALRFGRSNNDSLACEATHDSNTINNIENFINKHQPLFEKFGLKFSVSDENKMIETRTLKLDITDKDKFINFLSTINNNQNLASGLKPLVEDYIQRLFYDLLAPNSFTKKDRIDTEILLLTNLDKISSNIDNLFNKRLVDTIKRVAPYRNSGYFKEYVELSQYFENEKHFGPRNWHTDSTNEYYHISWQVILTNLDKLEKNSNAKCFLKLCLVNFLDYANYAKKDINTEKHTDGTKNLKYLLEVIENLEERHNRLKE